MRLHRFAMKCTDRLSNSRENRFASYVIAILAATIAYNVATSPTASLVSTLVVGMVLQVFLFVVFTVLYISSFAFAAIGATLVAAWIASRNVRPTSWDI